MQAVTSTANNPPKEINVPAISIGDKPQTAIVSIASQAPSPLPPSSNVSANPYLQSLLELQQMHHRHAMAQQQAQFMTILQQQQHAESESSFRNAFLVANKL